MMTEARAGFTAFNEGTEGRPRGRLRAAAPEARRRRELGRTAARRDPAAEQAQGADARWPTRRSRSGSSATARCCGCALARPKANIVDAAMIAALRRRARRAPRPAPAARRRCSTPRGRTSASARASRSTCPAAARRCSRALHALIVAMLEFPAPILVAVRGQCLGGGLEVALRRQPIFAAPDAQFGQPEIEARRVRAGGVGAAAAPRRTSRRPRTCCSPAARSARDEARAIGLVQTIADDPEAAALAYFDQHLAGKSAASLACAVRRGARRRCSPTSAAGSPRSSGSTSTD